jgi:hypothetical protein
LLLDVVTMRQIDHFYIYDRFVLLISVALPSVLFLVLQTHPAIGEISMCMASAQGICIAIPFCSIISDSVSGIFTPARVHVMLFLFIVAQILVQYWSSLGTSCFALTWLFISIGVVNITDLINRYIHEFIFIDISK